MKNLRAKLMIIGFVLLGFGLWTLYCGIELRSAALTTSATFLCLGSSAAFLFAVGCED